MDYSILRRWVLVIACLCLALNAGCADEYRTIVDSRGVAVQVPTDIERVVTISDGFVEEVMTVIGLQDKLIGLGSEGFSWISDVKSPTSDGGNRSVGTCMHVAAYLNPWIRDLPVISSWSMPPNYEMLVSLDPDVVIIRAGDCTFYMDEESRQKAIDTIESLDIPLVVTYAPNTYDEPNMSIISEEIRIVGQVFGKEDEAVEIADYLESEVEFVSERTAEIQDNDKPRVLIFGMSPKARGNGGAGYAYGLNTTESYFVENIVNAKNAYQENGGSTQLLSSEHILALEPDVIVLATSHAYPTPQELYEAPYYQNLQDMRAIKNKRVVALPWTPVNCAKRLEYPIEVMVIAKATYPELFQDVDLDSWILDFYQNVYDVDETQAKELRSLQGMDWTLEEGL